MFLTLIFTVNVLLYFDFFWFAFCICSTKMCNKVYLLIFFMEYSVTGKRFYYTRVECPMNHFIINCYRVTSFAIATVIQ